MKKFKKASVMPLVIAIITVMLVFTDSLVAPLFATGVAFTWMAFLNWTVFFGATNKERLRAPLGYIVGYLAANAMLWIGSNFVNIVSLQIINITFALLVGVFLVTLAVCYLDNAKQLYLNSVPAIFLGIALTFSGAGIGLAAYDVILLMIILIYGVLGLICSFATNYFVTLINRKLKY